DGETLPTRFDLMLGFFARAVENRSCGSGQIGGGLQQQRGLADPRLATEEHERTGNDASTEDAIEFVDARRDPGVLFDFDVGVERRDARAAARGGVRVSRRRADNLARTFLDERVPRTAVFALALPLTRLRAAFLADEYCLW